MKVCLACEHPFEGENWDCPACGYAPQASDGYLSFSPELRNTNESFCVESFPHLAQLEEGNFWFRSRNRLLIWALGKYFPNARKFLELGCGTGFVLSGIRQAFPRLRVYGGEAFSQGLAVARRRLPGVILFQMDARRVPFEKEFDVIGAFDVLEHIEQDETVLAQMFRATKPGGGIILTVPQHPFLWSDLDDYSFHKRRYRRAELAQIVERAGFQIIRSTSFVSLLLPAMMVSRMGRRKMRPACDVAAELGIGGVLNWILETILAVERLAIVRGISFWAGGSLLVVARRGEK